MEYDVAMVGAGPAGLAAAIRLKQLSKERGLDLSVCVLEKGEEVGSHILSGEGEIARSAARDCRGQAAPKAYFSVRADRVPQKKVVGWYWPRRPNAARRAVLCKRQF